MNSSELFKELANFVLPKEEWVIAPFVEPSKPDELVYFTSGLLHSTNEEDQRILILKTYMEKNIVGIQAFFLLKEKKNASGEPEIEITPVIDNVFRCGWRTVKPEEVLMFKDKFLTFLKKQIL